MGDLSVGQLTLTELQNELQRRITNLLKQKNELLDKITDIDRQLESVQALSAAGLSGEDNGDAKGVRAARSRKLNKQPLKELLVEIVRAEPRTTREAAEAALAAGYITSSTRFSNIVSTAFHTDERFVKKDGKWTLDSEHA